MLFSTFDFKRPEIFSWPFFKVLWSYLLTTKLSCLQKNNFGHTIKGRALRSQGSGQAEEGQEEEYEEEIEESDLENRDYSWKKTIMIGPSFQAFVPSDLDAYGDTLPYGNFLFPVAIR